MLATEDMERARAAARSAMEEGEVLEDGPGKASKPGAQQQHDNAAPPAPPPAAFAFPHPSTPFPAQLPLGGRSACFARVSVQCVRV